MLYEMIREGKALTIILKGDLDHHMTQQMRSAIDIQIQEHSTDTLIIDFKNSNFMDSSGIGLIMGRYKLLNKNGGRICAINMNSAINRIFQISGLYKIVNVK